MKYGNERMKKVVCMQFVRFSYFFLTKFEVIPNNRLAMKAPAGILYTTAWGDSHKMHTFEL